MIVTYVFRGLSLEASIGFLAAEKAAPQRVLIDIEYDCRAPGQPVDEVGAVLDYDAVRRRVVAIVGKRHFNLQETLCRAITDALLEYPEIRRTRVSLRKPDAYPDMESVGVLMETVKP